MKQDLNIPEGYDGSIFRMVNQPGHPIPSRHRHIELEANLVLRGNARYLVDSKVYSLEKGSMAWLFPGQEHQLFDYSSDFVMWVITFRPALVHSCREPDQAVLKMGNPEGRYIRQLMRPSFEQLNIILEKAEEYSSNPDHFNAILHYLLLTGWSLFNEVAPRASEATFHPSIAKIIHKLSLSDSAETVEELAVDAGLSRSHFLRLFKSQAGITLTRFRNDLRVERFLKYYGQGDTINMLEAALAAGFGSYAQFHRVFREVYRVGPRQWFRGKPDVDLSKN